MRYMMTTFLFRNNYLRRRKSKPSVKHSESDINTLSKLLLKQLWNILHHTFQSYDSNKRGVSKLVDKEIKKHPKKVESYLVGFLNSVLVSSLYFGFTNSSTTP